MGQRENKKAVITLERRKRWLELKIENGASIGAAGHCAREASALRRVVDFFVDANKLSDDTELQQKIDEARAEQERLFGLYGPGGSAVEGTDE